MLNRVVHKIHQGQTQQRTICLHHDIVIRNGERLPVFGSEHFELIADFLKQPGNVHFLARGVCLCRIHASER